MRFASRKSTHKNEFSHVRCQGIRGCACLRRLGKNSHWASRPHGSWKKAPKSTEIFSKNQNFRNSPGFKKIKIFAFLEFQNFWLFDFFLDDGKIFFTRNFFSFWIGRPAHVRVGRWRVGFLSVTASESQKYRKRFKIPQNHKTKKFAYRGGSEI